MFGIGLTWSGKSTLPATMNGSDDIQSLRSEINQLKAQLKIIHLILETYTKSSSSSK